MLLCSQLLVPSSFLFLLPFVSGDSNSEDGDEHGDEDESGGEESGEVDDEPEAQRL